MTTADITDVAGAAGAARTVAIVVDSPPAALGSPGEHGCARLAEALEGHGWRVRPLAD